MKKGASAVAALIVAVLVYAFWPENEDAAQPPVTYPREESAVANSREAKIEKPLTTELAVGSTPADGTLIAGIARHHHDGTGVPGVIVRAYDEHKDKSYEVVTNDAGAYALRELNPGDRGVDIRIEARTDVEGHHAVLVQPLKRLYPGDQWTAFDIEIVPNTGVVTGRVLGKQMAYYPNRVRTNIEALLSDLSNPAAEEAWRNVHSESTTPLAGVRVLLTLNRGRLQRDTVQFETITDTAGRYRFEGVPVGAGSVQAITEGRSVRLKDGFGHKDFKIADGEVLEIEDLILEADAVAVTGRVVDVDGRPILNARVNAEPVYNYEEGYRESRATITTTTNAYGEYTISGLRASSFNDAVGYLGTGFASDRGGTYLIRADAEGYAPAQVAVPVLQQKSVDFAIALYDAVRLSSRWPETKDEMGPPPSRPKQVFDDRSIQVGDLVLKTGATVAGYVVDTHDRPQANVEVQMVSEKPERYVGFHEYPVELDAVKTDVAGAFKISDVPELTYTFEVKNATGAVLRAHNEPLRVEDGTRYEDIEVVIESALDRGDIVANIVDVITGKPVSDFAVQIVELKSPQEPNPQYGHLHTYQDTGRFRLEGISAGDVTLEIHTEGYAPDRIQARVDAGALVELEIPLQRGGTLRGHTTRNGELAGSWVLIEGLVNGSGQSYGEGVYELPDLKPGTYTVKYTSQIEGGPVTTWDTEYRWVEIESGAETVADVDFGGTCTIEGGFSGPEGLRWFVQVYDASIPGDDKLRAMAGKFEETGQYIIDNLDAGTYTVSAIARTDEEVVLEDSRQVTLAPDETLTLDFSL